MRWVDLRTGYSCNNRCRFCDQGDRRAQGDASFEALQAMLAPATGEGLWLAGGEVTLRPDLPRLIAAARAAGWERVGLQTNGRILAAPGAAERLRDAGLTDAIVALHAATPALHDWLVQAPGAHRQATVGLRRLLAAGIATRVNTVLTRSGTAEIGALAKLVQRLGAEGQRWILARPVGWAAAAWRMVVPRLALVRDPLVDAIREAWEERREAESRGIPLCVLGDVRAAAADRLDSPPVARAFPPGFEEPVGSARYGPPCTACPLRVACPGVDAGYVERFGWDEIGGHDLPVATYGSGLPPAGPQAADGASPSDPPPTPRLVPSSAVGGNWQVMTPPPAPVGGNWQVMTPPPRAGRPPGTSIRWARRWGGGDPVPGTPHPMPLILHVEAACAIGCPGCTVRAAYGDAWPTEPGRTLRRRLVRAASEGSTSVVFAGASPWSHPELPAVVREARRLGFTRIEVWGPLQPLVDLDAGTAEKLAGLTQIRAPRLGSHAEAEAVVRARLPNVALELYEIDTSPDVSMYQASGPAAVWAPCQRWPVPG